MPDPISFAGGMRGTWKVLWQRAITGPGLDAVTHIARGLKAEARFDELLAKRRATPEWGFVEREVELRLEKAA